MTNGFEQQQLGQISSHLADGANELSGLSGTTPSVPEAGASTGAVGEALGTLGGLMSAVTQGVAGFADHVDGAKQEYAKTDQDSADQLGQHGR